MQAGLGLHGTSSAQPDLVLRVPPGAASLSPAIGGSGELRCCSVPPVREAPPLNAFATPDAHVDHSVDVCEQRGTSSRGKRPASRGKKKSQNNVHAATDVATPMAETAREDNGFGGSKPVTDVAANDGGAPGPTSTDSHASDANKEWRRLVSVSWSEVREKRDKNHKMEEAEDTDGASGELREGRFASADRSGSLQESRLTGKSSQTSTTRGGFFTGFRSRLNTEAAEKGEKPKLNGEDANLGTGHSSADDQSMASTFAMPQTFEEMGRVNATMIGVDGTWIGIVLDSFDSLVTAISRNKDMAVEQEVKCIALRIRKEVSGAVTLKQFRVCMLASLRSLLPKTWSRAHEAAWNHLWDVVEVRLAMHLERALRYRVPVTDVVQGWTDNDKRKLSLQVFLRLFELHPKSENYFKQNNERLAVMVLRALDFSANLFEEPKGTLNDITALALKHIMFGIPTTYFKPFIAGIVEQFKRSGEPDSTLEALQWALETVAACMELTIEEGSNPLLTAVLQNRPKQVRKELGKLPKNRRAGVAVGIAAWADDTGELERA